MKQQYAILLISLIFIITFLIAFLFQLWQKRQGKQATANILDANIFNTYNEIKTVLVKTQEQRLPIIIRKNAKGNSFNSSLIKIDSSSNSPTLLIDSLIPEEGNELMANSKFISVDFALTETDNEHSSIPYTFNALYLQRETYQGHPALRLSFPKIIQRNQRRNYNRVEPSASEPIEITLNLGNIKAKENVVNISGGGVGFYSNLDESVLRLGKKIDSISFSLPDGTEITSQLIIRWVTKNIPKEILNKKHYHSYCGAEFIDLDKDLREKIVQYVIKRERDDLKKHSLEFD